MEQIDNTVENRPYSCSGCGAVSLGREYESTIGNEIQTECVWSCSKCGRVFKRGIVSIKKIE